MDVKTVRCTACYSAFSDAEIQGKTACPSCGDKGVPMSISQDTLLKINWHELRILTIWASNYTAEKLAGSSSEKALLAIIKRLEAQRDPGWAPLTILGELAELVDEGELSECELIQNGKKTSIKKQYIM